MRTIRGIGELQSGLVRNLQGGRIDRTDDNTLQWAPHKHGSISLLKGDSWVVITRDDPIYFSTTDSDYFGTGLSIGLNYDVFAEYYDSSSFKLQLVPWAGDTSRSYPLQLTDGVWCYESLRFLGMVRLIDSGGMAFSDDNLQRLVVNWNNRKLRYVVASVYGNSVTSYPYTSWTEYSNMTRGEFLSIDPDVSVYGAAALYVGQNAPGGGDYMRYLGMGLNSTSEIFGAAAVMENTRCFEHTFEAIVTGHPRLGWNWITILTKVENTSYYMNYYSADGNVGKCMLSIET